MKTVTRNYTYKSIAELTDKEFETFNKFILNTKTLLDNINRDIYRDLQDQCTEGLRSMGYMFECDNIFFNDYNNPTDYYKLNYIGKLPDDIDISDSISVGVDSFDYDKLFGIKYDITYGIIFKIDYENNREVFDMLYITESANDFKKSFEVTDQEYKTILNFVTKYCDKIKEEYKPFKTDVDNVADYFGELLSLNGSEFKEYMNGYIGLGLYFDEDGHIVDYDWNYND